MKRRFIFKKFIWQVATLAGLVILFVSPVSLSIQKFGVKHGVIMPTVMSEAEANEIYPMFTCPCCDQPLDKDDPCCGSATQMIDYIDQKIKTGASKETIILATAKEFGLERLADQSQRETVRTQLLANAPKNAPKISVSVTKKDLGTVSQKKGVISTEFEIKNEGESDLVIDKLDTSCGCTSASVIYQGTEGTRFYMAGMNLPEPDPNWKASIAPGDTALVKVYYDPNVHKDLTGPVTREVTVHSNDPVDFAQKLTITLDQEK